MSAMASAGSDRRSSRACATSPWSMAVLSSAAGTTQFNPIDVPRSRSGGVSAAELAEGDPAAWVVGVGDSGEPPAAIIVVGVGDVFGGFGLGEEAVGVVSFGVTVGFVLQREACGRVRL